jgi:hypothetical protein
MTLSFYHQFALVLLITTTPQHVLSFLQSPSLMSTHSSSSYVHTCTRMNGKDDDNIESKSNAALSRRDLLSSTGQKVAIMGGLLTSTVGIQPDTYIANADEGSTSTSSPTPAPASFGASWNAVDGLNSLNSKSQFVSFDNSAYRAMRDDPTRTPQFKKAIENRLGDKPEDKIVVDLGTGPFAVFALIAAQAGAGKVYAIEASAEAAQSARALIKKQGYDDIITVVEGFSTDVVLEEKADFVIAEIVGSVASEEGAYATIRSAHSNLLKDPTKESSWIPSRIQTYAAPASYTLHNLFGPPEFDWNKLKGEPVRFNCRDKGLELLSNPVMVEDISFAQILTKEQDERNQKRDFTFTTDAKRIAENQVAFYQEFKRGNSSDQDSQRLARESAHSMTGIALWPRIILDDTVVIDSRHFGDGAHQRSHWQSVLPIMSDRPIGNINGGEQISISCDFTLPTDILKPPSYSIQGKVNYV